MITDNLCIFTDGETLTANGTSNVINVMPFTGKGEPVPFTITVSGYPATATIKATVQESADGTTFADVGVVAVPPETVKHGGVATFLLPTTLRKEYVRLSYTIGGAPASGKLWAGITRDAPGPYEKGQYIDSGKVVL